MNMVYLFIHIKTREVITVNVKNNTSIIEGRVSVCTLASLLKFFESNNVQVNTKSALLNEIVETFYGVLIENNMAIQVTDVEKAAEVLERLSTRRDVRVQRNLSKAILMQRSEEIEAENLKAMCVEGVRKFEELMNRDGADASRAVGVIADSGTQGVQLSKEAQIVPNVAMPDVSAVVVSAKEGESNEQA